MISSAAPQLALLLASMSESMRKFQDRAWLILDRSGVDNASRPA